MEDLIRSIQRHGVLQPINVRRVGDRYQIIAGERRWRASQELGTAGIGAIIVEATDQDMLQWAIIENAQRQDLNPMELADAFRRLIREFQFTQEEVAERVGQSRAHVANTMRLLELPDEIQSMVSRGTISAGAARALLAIKSKGDQLRLARDVEGGSLTVRQLEAIGARKRVAEARSPHRIDPNLAEVAEELQAALSLRVRISGTPKRGTVMVSYHSPSELARLHRRFLAAGNEPVTVDGSAAESLTV
jgi:ParB family chromosome partitioning protein